MKYCFVLGVRQQKRHSLLSFVHVHTMVAAMMADGVGVEMYWITEICGTVPV